MNHKGKSTRTLGLLGRQYSGESKDNYDNSENKQNRASDEQQGIKTDNKDSD